MRCSPCSKGFSAARLLLARRFLFGGPVKPRAMYGPHCAEGRIEKHSADSLGLSFGSALGDLGVPANKKRGEDAMTVGRILENKGRVVVTTSQDQTLGDAARLLAEYRIGAIVIGAPGESVQGILSERDIVRAVARSGAAALNQPVRDHMTVKVITCAEAMPITQVMEVMTAGKFRHLPVTRDGRLDGMISIGDVVKFRLAELENERRALQDYITAS
jgi:CBS domain-containing protein